MKFTFSKKYSSLAPKKYARVCFMDGKERRVVRLPDRQAGEKGIQCLEIGAEGGKNIDRRKFIILCRTVITVAKQNKVRRIAFDLAALKEFKNVSAEELGQLLAENLEMADFEFNAFKTPPKDGFDTVEEVLICGNVSSEFRKKLFTGQEIGKAVNVCRFLANTPGGDMTPTVLARAAKNAARGLPIKVTTLDEKEMKRIGMGALLSVAKGSTEKPTFTIIEYKGAAWKPIVLVGKGVTFDSGGLNIKTGDHMYEMHMDMSGAAAALYTVVLAARLKLKKHVIALLPAVENMPGNGAYRPGDVLKSLSGKTIEVTNTDAEGRLILADALTYAKRLHPSVVIDIATLTGAAMVALGLYASGLMTRDDELADKLLAAGEASGDYLWRLPLWDEYEEAVKGIFADVSNASMGEGARYGGAIKAGMFLWQFAKELSCPWAHLDIAPRMTAAPGDELAKGAAGAPVRALIRFIDIWPSTKK